MKTLRRAGSLLVLPFLAFAQPPAPTPAPATSPQMVTPPARLSAVQLEQLLGPIALYPDALIALILPASTQPTDIVLAARYLRDHGANLSQVESRAWDDSVKSLTHYPEVLKWLDENLHWTKQVGEAFADQPAEVMQAIQRLRARARTNGALATTPQQQVLVEPTTSVIRIVPAQPDVIYIPYYDPTIVYVREPIPVPRHPAIAFGMGGRVGAWLCNDFNWVHGTLWIGDRHRRWDHHHDWRHPVVPVPTVTVVTAPSPHPAGAHPPRQWRPTPRPPRSPVVHHPPQPRDAAPAVHPAAPRPTHRPPPSSEVARPPVISRPAMFENIATAAPAMGPATPAPASGPAPALRPRGRAGDAPRPEDRPRAPHPAPTRAPAIAVAPAPSSSAPPPAHPIPVVAPLHLVGGARAHYPTVSPAPAAPVPPPQAAPAPVINSAPAPENPPPPDRGDRPHRDRRQVD